MEAALVNWHKDSPEEFPSEWNAVLDASAFQTLLDGRLTTVVTTINSPVLLPPTLLLFGSGLLGLWGVGWRHRRED